ncbi:hypothetical protein BJQ94_05125 [Cryobacterium sp. SO2]|uniref:hypothetical protein n=1 Tax=Cryobacterium sp. SO2 TaxID=1897060 RepID=UPI00223D3383|nr:hypothetical protein [Cryobacterium sp. SO2]WEO78420.1 hypothetical protein BJQ94_05125 [Cryobacterium sp. SO2]
MGIDDSRRRRAGRMAAVACACLLLVPLAGCAADPKPAAPSSTPTATPVFASDEEALAAATEAYENYLSAYDAYWTGNATSKRDFLALSTGDAHEGEVESMAEWEEKGWTAVGSTTFDSMRLQSVSQSDSGQWVIRAYLCADSSRGDVVDASGASVAKSDRRLRLPLEVAFVTSSAESSDLKISESNVWTGTDFC